MKGTIKYVLIFAIAIVSRQGHGADTLSLDSYLEMIGRNYPLVKKANLYEEFVEAYALKGSGAFDPKVRSDYQAKQFDDKNYYRVWHTEAKIPTRFPVDFSVGYENNDGSFLNAENSVPDRGLVYGTINLSLVRGLMFDEQRYNVQFSELKGAKSQIEREILTREILFQAINTYLEWAAAFQKNDRLENYLETIQERHLNIIQLFVNGDKPAVDTIESRVNLNTAQKIYLESTRELIGKRQKLALFLWDDDGNPLMVAAAVYPESVDAIIDRLELLAEIQNPHFNNDPSIRKIENEIALLQIRNRLDREDLKPQIDLKYNTIVDLGQDDLTPSLNLNDYKFGVNVEVPIRNRKVRGELRLNEIMVEQALEERTQYQQNLLNKFQGLALRRDVQEDVIQTVEEKLTNSTALYQAETLKFDLGESSVFLLNQRELKLLEAEIDQIKSFKKLGSILCEQYYLRMGQ